MTDSNTAYLRVLDLLDHRERQVVEGVSEHFTTVASSFAVRVLQELEQLRDTLIGQSHQFGAMIATQDMLRDAITHLRTDISNISEVVSELRIEHRDISVRMEAAEAAIDRINADAQIRITQLEATVAELVTQLKRRPDPEIVENYMDMIDRHEREMAELRNREAQRIRDQSAKPGA
jgi:chromosome segregation ATPase